MDILEDTNFIRNGLPVNSPFLVVCLFVPSKVLVLDYCFCHFSVISVEALMPHQISDPVCFKLVHASGFCDEGGFGILPGDAVSRPGKNNEKSRPGAAVA
jgi:hypothetical protein